MSAHRLFNPDRYIQTISVVLRYAILFCVRTFTFYLLHDVRALDLGVYVVDSVAPIWRSYHPCLPLLITHLFTSRMQAKTGINYPTLSNIFTLST